MSETPSPPPRASVARELAIPAALLVLATLAAHASGMRGVFVWDDDLYVSANENLARLDGLFRIWFVPTSSPSPYPLVFSTYWFEYRLWGLDPLGYHVVNGLLHAGGAALLWRILARLGVSGAWVAAAVFALHPLRVESVAQVAERKDVLSGFFYFASALAWLRFREKPTPRAYAATLGAFVLAMLAKTVVCTLPVAILVVEWMRGGRPFSRDFARRVWLPLVPFFAVGLALGAATMLWERFRTGAAGEGFDLSFAERTLIAGRALWFYVGKTFAPVGLATIYPKWSIDAGDPAQWLAPVAAAAVLAGAWFARGRVGRGPFAALAYYIATMGPALGFVDYSTMHYSYVADHYQYLGGLGVSTLAVAAAAGSGGRILPRSAGLALAAATLVALGALSWKAGLPYRSVEDFWRHNVRANPSAPSPRYDLALALIPQGRIEEAEAELREAIRIEPRYVEARIRLAGLREEAGRIDEAIAEYERALAAEPLHAKAARARATAASNLGNLHRERGEADRAAELYETALEIRPDHPLALNGLASIRLAQGRLDEAIAGYERAVEVSPGNADLRANLGLALSRAGRVAEAAEQYERVAALTPDSLAARLNLARSLLAAGDPAGAAEQFRAAGAIDPKSSPAQTGLADSLAAQGRAMEAIQLYRLATTLDPENAAAWSNWGTTLARAGEIEEATAKWRRALELDPNNRAARDNLARARRDP